MKKSILTVLLGLFIIISGGILTNSSINANNEASFNILTALPSLGIKNGYICSGDVISCNSISAFFQIKTDSSNITYICDASDISCNSLSAKYTIKEQYNGNYALCDGQYTATCGMFDQLFEIEKAFSDEYYICEGNSLSCGNLSKVFEIEKDSFQEKWHICDGDQISCGTLTSIYEIEEGTDGTFHFCSSEEITCSSLSDILVIENENSPDYLNIYDTTPSSNTYIPPSSAVCPDLINGYLASDGNCYCYDGYFWDETSNLCKEKEELCKEIFGTYSEVQGDKCGCKEGYTMDPENLVCVQEEQPLEPNTDTPSTATSTNPNNSIFEDVSEATNYSTAIKFVKENGIVQGYTDNTYKPDKKINRAEFTKILAEAKYGNEIKITDEDDCFTDVKRGTWYSKYVCFSKNKGLIEGYPDGSFGPDLNINIMEALKIALEAFYEDIPAIDGVWYEKYWQFAEQNNLTLPVWTTPSHQISRGEMAELIYRIKK